MIRSNAKEIAVNVLKNATSRTLVIAVVVILVASAQLQEALDEIAARLAALERHGDD